MRAQEYNVTLLKSQIENLTTELQILKTSNEKYQHKMTYFKTSSEKLSMELEQEKKSKNNGLKSHYLPSNIPVLGKKSAAKQPAPVQQAVPLKEMRTVGTNINVKAPEIEILTKEIDEKQARIDELEKSMGQLTQKSSENE